MFDVAPDGRFLMLKDSQRQRRGSRRAKNLIVVQNWFDELKRLVPTN